MNDPKTMSDMLQEIKKSLNFRYGICFDSQNGEPFDKEKGLAMAICKKLGGNRGAYYDIFKEWCHEEAAVEEGAQG